MIDVAADGTLMSKTKDEAYNLIEELTFNTYQWSSERGQSEKVGGKFDVDALTLPDAKMDARTKRIHRLNVSTINVSSPFPTCDSCGSFDHLIVNYSVGNPFASSSSEPVAYVNLGRILTLL